MSLLTSEETERQMEKTFLSGSYRSAKVPFLADTTTVINWMLREIMYQRDRITELEDALHDAGVL